MAAGRTEKPAACSLVPWQSTDMQRLRRGMEGIGMGRRSLPVGQCKSGFRWPCNLDQSAMAAGRPWRNLRGFGGWERVL